MRPLSLVLLFFLLPLLIPAQQHLGEALPFFQKKSELYQRWLEAKNMGDVLEVGRVQLEKEGTELELFLHMRTTDPDLAASLWRALESGFAEQNAGQTLYEALFHTFTRLMEIPPAQGNVQVYVPNENGRGYSPCFQVWIWEENGQLDQLRQINNCKDQPLDIAIKLPRPVLAVNNEASVSVRSAKSGEDIFAQVLAYARGRYEQPVCEGRDPQVEVEKQTDYSLTFTVTDLCREVLTDERESIWCQFVQRWWGPCNDMRRERLEFIINYIPTAEGYLLSGRLTGKFGSGIYRPRTGWMDMEPDFEEAFLKPYVRRFQQDLKNYLEGRD